MRVVAASVAMVLGGTMLVAATAPTAFTQDASVAPSANVEASGSPLHDAVVELLVGMEGDPAHEWAIAVARGSPSVSVLTLEDVGVSGFYGAFTVAVLGQSANVEMTAALPSGWSLIQGACLELHKQPPGKLDALVPPRRLVIEVVQGGRYNCFAISDPPGGGAGQKMRPTDAVVDAPSGSSSGGWRIVLAVMAAVIAGTLLIFVRGPRASVDRS
jgi:hypothetical protein